MLALTRRNRSFVKPKLIVVSAKEWTEPNLCMYICTVCAMLLLVNQQESEYANPLKTLLIPKYKKKPIVLAIAHTDKSVE